MVAAEYLIWISAYFGDDGNHIANPDNIFFSNQMRTLFIGEDSGTHVNNFLSACNVDTGKLTRIMSVASGAESTGLQVVESLNATPTS